MLNELKKELANVKTIEWDKPFDNFQAVHFLVYMGASGTGIDANAKLKIEIEDETIVSAVPLNALMKMSDFFEGGYKDSTSKYFRVSVNLGQYVLDKAKSLKISLSTTGTKLITAGDADCYIMPIVVNNVWSDAKPWRYVVKTDDTEDINNCLFAMIYSSAALLDNSQEDVEVTSSAGIISNSIDALCEYIQSVGKVEEIDRNVALLYYNNGIVDNISFQFDVSNANRVVVARVVNTKPKIGLSSTPLETLVRKKPINEKLNAPIISRLRKKGIMPRVTV